MFSSKPHTRMKHSIKQFRISFSWKVCDYYQFIVGMDIENDVHIFNVQGLIIKSIEINYRPEDMLLYH